MRFPLTRDGYLTKFLIAGRVDSELRDDSRDNNQLRYERHLRGVAALHAPLDASSPVRLGGASQLGAPWRYYYSYGNLFVDCSDFYLNPVRVELLAATRLEAARDLQVRARVWSCDALDVWVNGAPAAAIEKPVYKPIRSVDAILSLREGLNDLLIRLETLGVRDTSVAFALQLLDHRGEVSVVLPDEEGVRPCVEADRLLGTACLSGSLLTFAAPLPQGSRIRYDTENPDFRRRDESVVEEDVSGLATISLRDFAAFSVAVPAGDTVLVREFERIGLRAPVFLHAAPEKNREEVLRRLGAVASLTRGENDGFALYPMLARYALGQRLESDLEEIRVTLRQIDRRMDCADFMTCGLLRLMKTYDLGAELLAAIRETMLGFRFWMNEEGFDGMCFWSENHSLMFFETAYFFGREYPDDVFVRSGKTGRELAAHARQNIGEWLDDVLGTGFDEFNSGTYGAITLAAMLNLVDFAEEELGEKARKACDKLLRMVAVHCFRDVVVSPQGRIYRDVLYPQRQSLQGLVQFLVPRAPYVFNEWIAALAKTRYTPPADFEELMGRTGWQSYATSNARVDLYKTADYMLTSVQSPRRDGVTRAWEHRMQPGEEDTFRYTKSLNECFHGTMQFEPGVRGYQQNLWYASLDQDLTVFSNHPGQSCEAKSEVRPGYWYGNGVMPAMCQEKNVLALLYRLPKEHPIRFIHLFWNEAGFDETARGGGWVFGRRGNGYLGVWCSEPLVPHDDNLFGCELRAYGAGAEDGDAIGLVCVCGSQAEDGGFAAFRSRCLGAAPALNGPQDELSCAGFTLRYEARENDTQWVD